MLQPHFPSPLSLPYSEEEGTSPSHLEQELTPQHSHQGPFDWEPGLPSLP